MKTLFIGIALVIGSISAVVIQPYQQTYPPGIRPPPCPPSSMPAGRDPPNHAEFIVYPHGTWDPPYMDDNGNPKPGAVWHPPGSWGYIGPPH